MNPWWLLILLATFLIGVTKSGFGSGVGLMIVPMTAIGMGHIPGRGAEAALGLMLPLLILGDLVAVYQYRNLFAPRLIRHLLPGTVAGVVLGGLLLYAFHQQPPRLLTALIRIEIGVESILLVSLHWWRTYRGVQQHLLPEPLRSHLTGAFAAVSSTLAHAAGPIIAMYLLPLRLDRRLFVGTCALYFFLLNTAKLPAYWASGMFARAEPTFAARFIPLVLAGALVGAWLNKRITDALFTKLTYAITFALGCYVLAQGVLSLVP